MTNEEDKIALTKFSSRKGSAVREVLSHKANIEKWMSEGWSLKAIWKLMKSKGTVQVKYNSFCTAVKKVFKPDEVKRKKSKNKNDYPVQAQGPHFVERRGQRPHERKQKRQEFVTVAGVDHIGLDNKDE